MKRYIHFFALAVTLTSATTLAAEKPSREEVQERWQELANQLELTEEQRADIVPVMRQQAADLKALQDNTALKPRHKVKRARQINEAASAQIRVLLTPGQQTKYDALREENKKKLREQFRERAKQRKAGAEN